jgi:hypothetical protein
MRGVERAGDDRRAGGAETPVPDVTVDPGRLGELAGAMRTAATGLDLLLAELGAERNAAGLGLLEPAWRHYLELCRRGATPVRDELAVAADRVIETAGAYAEGERRACRSFHRLGAALPDPWPPR